VSKTATANGLRALNPAEKRAVELHGLGNAMRSIIIQTGLSEKQIETAIGWHAEWEKLRAQAARTTARQAAWNKIPTPGEPDTRSLWTLAEQAENGATADVAAPDVLPAPANSGPVDEPETADFDGILADAIAESAAPIVVHVVGRETEAEFPAEPEPVGWDAALADEDGSHPDELTPPPAPTAGTDGLLSRAEASVQPRVRQLAATVREQLTELTRLLDSDEKVRTLTIAAEVLRRQLATTEAELAALLGNDAAPREPAPEPEPCRDPSPSGAVSASTSTMRAWAIANGWEVPVRGILRAEVVAAYNAAHEGAS
jgi:hypothetical protein